MNKTNELTWQEKVEIYEEVQRAYRREDAERHLWDHFEIWDYEEENKHAPEELLDELVERYEKFFDCNYDENSTWRSLISFYFSGAWTEAAKNFLRSEGIGYELCDDDGIYVDTISYSFLRKPIFKDREDLIDQILKDGHMLIPKSELPDIMSDEAKATLWIDTPISREKIWEWAEEPAQSHALEWD